MDFDAFKMAVAGRFDDMVKHPMFRVEVDKDLLWSTYLQSFPAGTDPMFRKRTEHDCGCCRNFIRTVGDAVAIIDEKLVSVWDVEVENEPAYQAVADALSRLAKAHPIRDKFLHRERHAGTDKNFEDAGEGKAITWKHFYVTLPKRNQGADYVCHGPDIAEKLSESRATHDVFLRSLTELTRDAINTTMDLIKQGSLYRGNEHQHAVESLNVLKWEFDALPPERQDLYVWSRMDTVAGSVARIRNTSIGTLLVDLSAGLDLEDAVRKFEAVMAPANYKRPTALVTKAMVEAAKKAVEELGLTSALERRYAVLPDISVNDILFANRDAKKIMTGTVFDTIATKGSAPNLSKVETVPIDKFLTDIVPNVSDIEVFLEGKHTGNLVSLIAPQHPSAKPLLKWRNGFSWSYNGDLTDSIKERVKNAGGNVVGDLCCRLAWFNLDDLDLHMLEMQTARRATRYEIYYGSRGHKSPNGGDLDVDMNAGHGKTRQPVENIFYDNRRTMQEGTYELFVHQFSKRETSDIGFEVEIDWLGEVHRFAYDKPLKNGENVTVATMTYSHSQGIVIRKSLPFTSTSKKVWGLDTQAFHKVNVLMRSPNHWDGEDAVGNRHVFFMLDGCANDGQARGFFNEFLRPDLDKHRKVIEIVGGKMKVPESPHQLSGLGFSDTKRDEVLVRVSGNFTRTLKVMF